MTREKRLSLKLSKDCLLIENPIVLCATSAEKVRATQADFVRKTGKNLSIERAIDRLISGSKN